MVFDGGGVALRNMGLYGLGVMGCLEPWVAGSGLLSAVEDTG